MDEKTIADFIKLFRGRGDVYGHEEGRCVKEPLTVSVFKDHLSGVAPIGVYPMVQNPQGDCYTVWGCSDIDIEDHAGACSIRDALGEVGVTAWIEKSRSKGYHVWVFASAPVPASDMRRMLLAAHQVANYPAREVNPKQETLKQGQYGNYVRIPYPNYEDTTTNKRRIIFDDQTPYHIDHFIQLALDQRTPPSLISNLAGYYKPPVNTIAIKNTEVCESLAEALDGLSPLGRCIWRDGPLPTRDRSSTLAKLGHECVRSGMNPSATKIVLMDADKRWGKYLQRPNGELEIDKLVARVFT